MPNEIFIVDDCEGIASTTKAVLVRCPDWVNDQWVPKSVIDDHSEVFGKNTDGQLIVQQWWAKKAGIY